MDIKKLQRAWHRYYTKFHSLIHEKKFRANGTRLKYMFYESKGSETLLVSFPACDPNTARYNYMRTLHPFKCNKLFLLDDFGDNHRGCYLIEDNVEKTTKQLLLSIINRCESRIMGGKLLNIIFLGSSKGGYSALNFSLLIPNIKVVIGAPQYYLGRYLAGEKNLPNLKFIIGEINEKNIEELDFRLKNRIVTSSFKPKVYFHYSRAEHTYEDHVKDLLSDLKCAEISVEEDVQYYPQHGGLKDFYPPYLVKTIKEILS